MPLVKAVLILPMASSSEIGWYPPPNGEAPVKIIPNKNSDQHEKYFIDTVLIVTHSREVKHLLFNYFLLCNLSHEYWPTHQLLTSLWTVHAFNIVPPPPQKKSSEKYIDEIFEIQCMVRFWTNIKFLHGGLNLNFPPGVSANAFHLFRRFRWTVTEKLTKLKQSVQNMNAKTVKVKCKESAVSFLVFVSGNL